MEDFLKYFEAILAELTIFVKRILKAVLGDDSENA